MGLNRNPQEALKNGCIGVDPTPLVNTLMSVCLLIILDILLLVQSIHCNPSLNFTTLHPTTLHCTFRHFTSSHLHFTTLLFVLTHLHFLPLYFT